MEDVKLNVKEQISFNPIRVCDHKQLRQELGVHLHQDNLGLDNVGEFCDGPLQKLTLQKRV